MAGSADGRRHGRGGGGLVGDTPLRLQAVTRGWTEVGLPPSSSGGLTHCFGLIKAFRLLSHIMAGNRTPHQAKEDHEVPRELSPVTLPRRGCVEGCDCVSVGWNQQQYQ